MSGNGQQALVGEELPQPLVVRVIGANGRGQRGQLVNFRVISGGGRMFAGSSLTDGTGLAQDYWTLGPSRGIQQVDVVSVDPTTGAKETHGSFTATALLPAAVGLSTAALDLGTVAIGGSSAPQTLSVNNSGDQATGLLAVSVTGTDADDFQITANDCADVTLAGGATCNITIVFSPEASGGRTATLNVSAVPGGSATAALSGTGLASPDLVVIPAGFDFGTVNVGSASTFQTFTVVNRGGSTAQGVTAAVTGDHSDDFLLAPDSRCNNVSLSPGQNCQGGIQFRPTAAGSRSADLSITSSGGQFASAQLIGAGVSPAQLSISPSSNDYGSVNVGTASQPVQFTVTNTGGQASGAVIVAPSGPDAVDFVIANNACGGVPLPPAESCTVDAVFRPSIAGTRTADLVASASPGGSASAALIGFALAPEAALSISPTSVNFGTVLIDNQSPTQVLTVTNLGGLISGTLAAALGGSDPGKFLLGTDTCTGATLAAGSLCTVEVLFAPTASGGWTASLTVSSSPGGTVSATLNGIGTTPASLSASPNAVDFGTVLLGSGRSATITVQNGGGTESGTIGAAITGTDAADFFFSPGRCVGASLEPTATCDMDVTFSPRTNGTRTATLTITATPGGPVEVTLTGEGISSEVCDGIDNDGDGLVDDGFPYCIDGRPAPNTNGLVCDAGYQDLDGNRANGCEVRVTASRAADTVADSTVVLGPVQLQHDMEPRMQECPICRVKR